MNTRRLAVTAADLREAHTLIADHPTMTAKLAIHITINRRIRPVWWKVWLLPRKFRAIHAVLVVVTDLGIDARAFFKPPFDPKAQRAILGRAWIRAENRASEARRLDIDALIKDFDG